MFEIEKRALFENKNEFDDFIKKVTEQAEFVDKYVYKSFLFKKPEFIRIRITKDSEKVEITRKEGDYNSPTRKEINEYINIIDLPKYVEDIEERGFSECVCVKTESMTYKADGLTIALNTISNMGRIVEVEALTDNEEDVPKLEQQVSNMMDKLNLKELDPKIYQGMMDKLYSQVSDISKQDFSI